MATTGKIKITLSDRRPVTIEREQWPLLASADRFWGGSGIECQANETASICVRTHDDGRALVYCDRDRGPGGMPAGYRGTAGGFLLEPEPTVAGEFVGAGEARMVAAIVRAIRRCAGMIDSPELADECIASLPAEDL